METRAVSGEALVAEWVAIESEMLQRGTPPQGRREGHQPRVADGGGVQIEAVEFLSRVTARSAKASPLAFDP